MPQLREWMLHYPSDWTPPQAMAYTQDTVQALTAMMNQVMSVIGPEHACACLLAVVLGIAAKNPVFLENIKDAMGRTYDTLEKMDPFANGGVAS